MLFVKVINILVIVIATVATDSVVHERVLPSSHVQPLMFNHAPLYCENSTRAIQLSIQSLLLGTPASHSSSVDLDALELALQVSIKAEGLLASAAEKNTILVVEPASMHTSSNVNVLKTTVGTSKRNWNKTTLTAAINAYRIVIDETPHLQAGYCRLAELLLVSKDAGASLQVLDELLLRWPKSLVALRLSLRASYLMSNFSFVVAQGERLLTLVNASNDSTVGNAINLVNRHDLLLIARACTQIWMTTKQTQKKTKTSN
jgi:hypothetical protein